MRKKLLVSVLVTVMCIAAFAVTSFAVELTGPSSVTNGSEIEIKITGTMKGLAANVQTTGLEFVSVNGGLSDEETLILLDDFGGMEGVYKYRVTAANGQPVSFALTEVFESDGEQDIPADNLTWSGTVGGSFSTTSSSPAPTQNNQPAGGQTAAGGAAATADQNAAGVQQSGTAAGGDAAAAGLASDAAVSAVPSPTATQGPQTADGSVSIWLLCIGAAACAVIAVLIGRKMFKKA